MKIAYDDMYHIKIEYPETLYHTYAKDIEEFKRKFLEHMERCFDNIVNEQLQKALELEAISEAFKKAD